MFYHLKSKPALLSICFLVSFFSTSQVSLLKDINTNTDTSFSISSGSFLELNGNTFFTMALSSDPDQGSEIWVTNSSIDNAHKFNYPNAGNYVKNLIKLNNQLIFSEYSDVGGIELWCSDGTANGTRELKDILVGTGSSDPSNFTQVGNYIYFTANTTGFTTELWKTNGTPNGTIKIKELPNTGYMLNAAERFISFNNHLYFFYQNSVTGTYDIWISDGTNAGTVKCADNFGNELKIAGTPFKTSGDFLYFGGSTDGLSNNLWVTDGTPSGTLALTDFNINFIKDHNNFLYFDGFVDSIGSTLWKTDGTLSGTVFLVDPYPAAVTFSTISTINFVNDTLYFNPDEYFKYIEATNELSLIPNLIVQGAVEIENGLILYADYTVNNHGYELVKLGSDIEEIIDINSGGGSSNAKYRYQMDSILIFEANNGYNGNEFWKINLQDFSAEMSHDFAYLSVSSNIGPLTLYNNKVFFSAMTDDVGNTFEPWVTDGTTLGTHLLAELNPGASGSVPDYFVEINDTLYIFSRYPSFQLHKTDGTTAGTSFVTTVNYEMGYAPVAFNNQIYFCGTDSNGSELWKTDGTASGTAMVTDIQIGTESSNPNSFLPLGNQLFFLANDGINGNRLWVTDGTQSGTHLANSLDSDPLFNTVSSKLKVYNNQVFFSTYDNQDISVHLSDGISSNSTTISTFSDYSEVLDVVFKDNFAYILLYGNNQRDLWKLNMTNSTQTFIQRTYTLDPILYLLNDTIYCVSHESNYLGNELYGITNQSAEPFLVEDIYPGRSTSHLTNPMTFNGQLMYTGSNNVVSEVPLIRQNGHSHSTTNSESGIHATNYKIQLNNKLIFNATQNQFGSELWVYDSQLDTISRSTEYQTSCAPITWAQNNVTYEISGLYSDTLLDHNGNDSIIKNLSLIINHPLNKPISNAPFIWQPEFGGCIGMAAINVHSADVFSMIDNVLPAIVQYNGVILTGNICHGIHTINITDSCNINYESYFVIPYPNETIYNVNNTDILDSVGYVSENCFVGYETIDTAYIQSITFEDSIATVIWVIWDGQNTYLDTAVYEVNDGNGNYIFQLSLYCPQKSTNNVFAITQSATLNEFTSLNDNTDVKMHLYPNPTNDLVTISFDGNNANYTIYDAQGKLIQTSKINSGGSISLKDVQTGVYFFELTTENGSMVKRVIKN